MQIKKTLFLDSINQAVAMINKKSPIFEMKNIRILSDNSKFTICSSDTDNFIDITVDNPDNKSDTKLDICVNGVLLQSIVKTLKENIKLSIDKNHLIINDESGVFKIKCFSSSSFPSYNVQFPIICKIDGLTLSNLLKSVSINITDEDYGICRLICRQKLLSVVVNDRKRLSFTEIQLDAEDFDIILSAKAMSGITRSVSQDCSILCEGNKFVFKTDNLFLLTRSVNTRYLIDHRKFFTREGYHPVELVTKDFASAIKRALLMAQVINKIVHIKISSNRLEVCGLDISLGNSTSIFNIDENHDVSGSIAVNGSFLVDVLNCINSKKFKLMFKSTFQPLLIEDMEKSTTHVLMPVRVGI